MSTRPCDEIACCVVCAQDFAGNIMLPRSSVIHPALGAIATVALYLCVADRPLLVSVLFACWLATAFRCKHLLGTTYRGGRLPGRWFNMSSRVVFLVCGMAVPCSCIVGGGRYFWAVALALYAYSFLDGGEWTGARSLRPQLMSWNGSLMAMRTCSAVHV